MSCFKTFGAGRLTIISNGRKVELSGKCLEVSSDGIFVDGKPLHDLDDMKVSTNRIEISGNIIKLESHGVEVVVNGNAGTIESNMGNVTFKVVKSNVKSVSGGVNCRTIKRNCFSKKGNVKMI